MNSPPQMRRKQQLHQYNLRGEGGGQNLNSLFNQCINNSDRRINDRRINDSDQCTPNKKQKLIHSSISPFINRTMY